MPHDAALWTQVGAALGALSTALVSWFVLGRQRRWAKEDLGAALTAAALLRKEAQEDRERARLEEREDRERTAATLVAQSKAEAEKLALTVAAEAKAALQVAGQHAATLAAQTAALAETQRLEMEKQTLILAASIAENTRMNEQALSAANNFGARLAAQATAAPVIQIVPVPMPAAPPAASLVVESTESVQVVETPEKKP